MSKTLFYFAKQSMVWLIIGSNNICHIEVNGAFARYTKCFLTPWELPADWSKCVHNFKLVFPLRYSDMCSTSTNYFLLGYKRAVFVVMECKCTSVIYVYELIFLLHTSRPTECTLCNAKSRDSVKILDLLVYMCFNLLK